MNTVRLLTAKELEAAGIMKSRTALRMAQVGLLPHYKLGARLRAIRFSQPEVLDALKKLSVPKVGA
ncbi:MAG TPA: hypothetical protein VKP13_13280 [Nitrospira sp.]|nr:hypothetical protein [Nitrospira sp.]